MLRSYKKANFNTYMIDMLGLIYCLLYRPRLSLIPVKTYPI